MIARFTTLLPFSLTMRQSEALSPYDFQHKPYWVKVYPPLQAPIDYAELGMYSPIPFGEVIRKLEPAATQMSTNKVLIEELPTIRANLIQIDFSKANFDRTRCPSQQEMLTWGDPPARLAFDVANNVIARLRTVTRGCELRSLDPDASFWRLDYLTNQGKILPNDPQLARRRGSHPFRWRVATITKTIWEKVQELPADFSPQIWDTLALDAEQILPDVNAAVALANAALEAFSKWLLDQLAATVALPVGLWKWIKQRDHFLKDPSVDDRFDPLLKAFTGRSLKEQNQLWKAYKDLRKARNSFSHAGKPIIDGTEVTVEIATCLVNQAQQIIDWCEALLPENSRRLKVAEGIDFFFPVNTAGFPTLHEADPAAGEASDTWVI